MTASADASAKSGWTHKSTGLGLDAAVDTGVLADQVIRRDFEFLKIDIDGKPIKDMAFIITRYDREGNAAERHVFVTDSSGWYKSAAKDKASMSNILDGNAAEGWYILNGQHSDPAAGDSGAAVWFGAQDVQKTGGSLVYGSYGIEELRTLSNAARHETLQYSSEKISIREEGSEPVFFGVMVDLEVTLDTLVRDCVLDLDMTRIGSEVEVEDKITYSHLNADNRYLIRIDYRDVETGVSVGTSELEFTPERTSPNVSTTGVGYVTVEGVIDTTGYNGTGGRIGAYTELYQLYSSGGNTYEMLILSHNEDLSDKDEMLYVPSVMTQACDTATLDHVGAYSQEASIRDRVRVTNIAPRSNYKLVAQALSNADGSVLGSSELRFSTGRDVAAADKTMPDITFDSRELAGSSATIYEYLYYLDEDSEGNVSEILAGEHTTPLDPDQTVLYASLDTLALSENGIHAVEASLSTKITDTVDLTSLAVDEEYVLEGVLMDADTGEALLDDQGNKITAQTVFTALAPNDQQILEFDFPILETAKEKDAPVKAVVFAGLYHKDVLAGVHENADDEDETVIIVPPEYKEYSDPDMTQETVVRESDVVEYKISWSQALYEEAGVWLRDTLSQGLIYVEGSARNEAGEPCEPEVDENVLKWDLGSMPAGSYGTITYEVLVDENIRIYPIVNNSYETSKNTPENWVMVGSLENPGPSDKEYANSILGQEIPVLNEETAVYDGKDIEYSLMWVNNYTSKAGVELRDTLSAGLIYKEDSASVQPSDIIYNDDGTTTLYWQIEADAHEWGRIGYTAFADTQILEQRSVYMVENDYDRRITREGETPDENGWQDIRILRNPVPHYQMEKIRLTDAPAIWPDSGLYGFHRGDVVDYEAVITNDGNTGIVFDINDTFESPGVFDSLKITQIKGKDVEILSEDQASVKILIRAGAQARIGYQAQVGMRAREYPAESAADDRDDPEDGYLNTAGTFNARVTYTDAEGNTVDLYKDKVTVTNAQGETTEYDMKVPDLDDKEDTANTPVQVPLPGYTITKERISDAPEKEGAQGVYGFRGGDTIVYDVIIDNTGSLDMEITVSDEFAKEIEEFFTGLKIVSVSGKELERLGQAQVRLRVSAGEKAVIRFEATAALDAEELLSGSAADRTKELLRNASEEEAQALLNDPAFDLLGYLNIAKGTDAAAIYSTNDGKTVKIHGSSDSQLPGQTEVIMPDGTVTLISTGSEYLRGLSERYDAAHTPVSIPEEPEPETTEPQPEPTQPETPEPVTQPTSPQPPEKNPAGPSKVIVIPEEPVSEPEHTEQIDPAQGSDPQTEEKPQPAPPLNPEKPAVPASTPIREGSVRTGDESNLTGWLLTACCALLAAAVAITVFACRHRRDR